MRYLAMLLTVTAVVLVSIVQPTLAPHEEPSQRLTDAAAIGAELERTLAHRLPFSSVPGVAVAVVRNGAVQLWQAGVVRAWLAQPVRAGTQFEGASLSKPLTAYAVLRLVRHGVLQLDAPIKRAGYSFTLRQVLSHSAGFNNDLAEPAKPVSAPGPFVYAGSGYVFLGEVIERATGQTFRDHMNTVVLPELGMADSQFGASTRADVTLAEPSIDVVLPLSIVIAVCTLIAGPLLLGHALLMRIFKWTRPLAASVPQHAIVLFALGCAAFALYRMFGWQNWPALALPSGFLLVLAVGAWKLVSLRVGGARIAGVCIAIFLVALLVLRPAVPLAERKPIALPAAGLRTTAGDDARFLSYLVTAARTDATFAEMVRPQVFVNPQQDWGLGVGLQHNGARIAWHWGVNFPGYQALAVVDVETGDVMVVLMNGGALSFSPEGYRFSGLELARNAVVAIQGGRHSAYWQGVQ